MKLDFWSRTLVATTVSVLLIGLFSAVYYNAIWSLAYTSVGLWTVGNFWLLGLALTLITGKKAPFWKLQLILFSKLVVWYGVGYLIMAHLNVTASSFLAGFNTFFVVLILKAVGTRFSDQK